MGPPLHPEETGENGGEPIFADINITPLTDVFLVMLVIFMVSALAVQVGRCVEKRKSPPAGLVVNAPSGLVVNPPSGRQRDVNPDQAALVLELPSSGGVYIGGKPFTDDEIDHMFRVAARDPQTQVIVRADRGIQLGRVVEVIERARGVGIGHVVIGTRAR
jgi:biopolymer transport protein TolR